MSRHARRRVRLTFDIPTASELGTPFYAMTWAAGALVVLIVLLVALG